MFQKQRPKIKPGDIIEYQEDGVERPSHILIISNDVHTGFCGYEIIDVNPSGFTLSSNWLDILHDSILAVYPTDGAPFTRDVINSILMGNVLPTWDNQIYITQKELDEKFGMHVKIVSEEEMSKLKGEENK